MIGTSGLNKKNHKKLFIVTVSDDLHPVSARECAKSSKEVQGYCRAVMLVQSLAFVSRLFLVYDQVEIHASIEFI